MITASKLKNEIEMHQTWPSVVVLHESIVIEQPKNVAMNLLKYCLANPGNAAYLPYYQNCVEICRLSGINVS